MKAKFSKLFLFGLSLNLVFISGNLVKAQEKPVNPKAAVVYYSYDENIQSKGKTPDAITSASLNRSTDNKTSNLRLMASTIGEGLNAPVYSIRNLRSYPFSYSEMRPSVIEENKAGKYPALKTVPDLSSYEEIYFGTPVWMGELPPPVKEYLRQANLHDKKITVFGIHLGSGFGRNIRQVKDLTKNTDVVEGVTVRADASNEEAKKAAQSLVK